MNVLDSSHLPVPPDPQVWERMPALRAAVQVRDLSEVFRLVQQLGYSQQRIGAMAGLSQPEVSAIMRRRRVMSYEVLHRALAGLGAPLGLAGLSSCRCRDPGRTAGQGKRRSEGRSR